MSIDYEVRRFDADLREAGVRSSNFNFGVPNECRRRFGSEPSVKVSRDDDGQN